MGYYSSMVKSLASYSPYELLYDQESTLPSSGHEEWAPIVDLHDPDIWAQFLHDWAKFFKKATTIENLDIA